MSAAHRAAAPRRAAPRTAPRRARAAPAPTNHEQHRKA